MTFKIAHISDIHIRNYRFHEEYKQVFEQLYKTLKEEKPDIIVNTGDTGHTKLQISPSMVDMTSKLFKNLADIAPFHVILGNHDLNLRNLNKIDVISPIVESLNHPNIHFHKFSKVVNLTDDINIHVLSIVDEDNWEMPTDEDKVSIALYHGSISGIVTDTGWVMQHGDIDNSTLNQFDYVLLGDIHKTNQSVDKKGKQRYPGSLIQQNHGETNDKGLLIWEIEDKDSFTCRHIKLENPKPFITVELTPTGKISKKVELPEGARLRLVANNNLPLDSMRRAVEIAKIRFKPEVVTFLNRSAGSRGEVEEIVGGVGHENLRNIEVQEELIDEYLKEYQVPSNTLDKVYKLNKKYNDVVVSQEDISRNINWKLNSIEWDNLFNYDEGNKIDFSKLRGIVGVFGKNFSGKSSICDSILYTMFNSTSKKERKNLNIINQTKDFGFGKVSISIGEKEYTIERRSEKYLRRLKGQETTEAKTDVDFSCFDSVLQEDLALNGETRSGTDANIRKLFGSVDDFLLTSMASQLDSLAFIGEGSTRRKEILAKFLDLELFDTKFKLAKEDASDLRGAIKRLEGRDFDVEIAEATSLLTDNEKETTNQQTACDEIKEDLSSKLWRQRELETLIDSIPAEIIDIDRVLKEITKIKENIESALTNGEELKGKISDREVIEKKITNFLLSLDIEKLKETKELALEQESELRSIQDKVKEHETLIETQERKTHLLKEVPCGPEFSHCKFINDAYVAIEKLSINRTSIESLKEEESEIANKIKELNPEEVKKYVKQYKQLSEKKASTAIEIAELKLEAEKNINDYTSLENDLQKQADLEQTYEENREAIENKEELLKEEKETTQELQELETLKDACEESMQQLYKQHGSLEQQVQTLEDQREELTNFQEEYSAYDLFMRCMHSSGISYDIIKKKLPVVNEEIAKVLANIVSFEVFLENDDKRLNIFIKHPQYEARPLAMGSGAEKTIASMAIRLALLTVSNLPLGNIFILDEPGTALDENNMEGFTHMLEMIKSRFTTVLLISHLESLKDCVDTQIVIDKREGFAHVEI